MTRVWILARLPLIREGLRALLATEKDLELMAPAMLDASAIVREIAGVPGGVVLLDVDLLERDGWGWITDLAEVESGVVPVVVGYTADDRRVAQALALGARGYLLRESSSAEMSAGIRAAAQGLYVLDPGIARPIIGEWPRLPAAMTTGEDEQPAAEEGRPTDLVEPLSERELEVLRLLARGLANKQIAAQLFITEHTVKFHIRAILGKLGAANRTEAVMLALQKGLVTL